MKVREESSLPSGPDPMRWTCLTRPPKIKYDPTWIVIPFPESEPGVPALERKWWTLIAVCTATFMLLLDITVVNVALPDIQRSLHSSFSDLQWVVDAYSLTLAAFLLTAGVLGDMFGRRVVFAVGLGVFTVSSLVCGISSTALMLNLARGAQGVGGAVMFATSLALIASAFQGRERGTAFGIYGAVIGAAVAVGPLIGGAITSGLGWRWIFFVNVPVGVVAIALTLDAGPGVERSQRAAHRLDRLRVVLGRALHARLRAGPRELQRVEQLDDPRPAHRFGRPLGGVPDRPSGASPTPCWTSTSSGDRR